MFYFSSQVSTENCGPDRVPVMVHRLGVGTGTTGFRRQPMEIRGIENRRPGLTVSHHVTFNCLSRFTLPQVKPFIRFSCDFHQVTHFYCCHPHHTSYFQSFHFPQGRAIVLTLLTQRVCHLSHLSRRSQHTRTRQLPRMIRADHKDTLDFSSHSGFPLEFIQTPLSISPCLRLHVRLSGSFSIAPTD
jgi:hypothetical protein